MGKVIRNRRLQKPSCLWSFAALFSYLAHQELFLLFCPSVWFSHTLPTPKSSHFFSIPVWEGGAVTPLSPYNSWVSTILSGYIAPWIVWMLRDWISLTTWQDPLKFLKGEEGETDKNDSLSEYFIVFKKWCELWNFRGYTALDNVVKLLGTWLQNADWYFCKLGAERGNMQAYLLFFFFLVLGFYGAYIYLNIYPNKQGVIQVLSNYLWKFEQIICRNLPLPSFPNL